MEKSLFSDEYRTLLRLLREARRRSGITQEALAERLGMTQSFVSKCERGERRLDLIELRSWILGIGGTLPEFVAEFEALLVGRSRVGTHPRNPRNPHASGASRRP